jgi:methylenetetrahydrofolate dehydrogenase (NADP+) / methenyltetrahydrofolate cyclohydrolase
MKIPSPSDKMSVDMSARILDGTAVAGQIRSELSSRAAAFTRRAGRQPGLGIVLVGDKPDSQLYVNSKLKSAGDEGMRAALSHLPASTSLDEILSLIDKLNADPITDGILVQAPLPDALGVSAMQKVFDAIDPSKDVDGVTPENVGLLVQNRADLIACTPAGIIELLHRSSVEIAGKHAVVIGRSDIVGKPVSMLLLHRHATVTVCHSRTKDLAGIAASGDILVAAIGRPGFVRAAFVRPGATVIDVGINLVTDASIASEIFHEGHPRRGLFERKGSVLVGDVHPDVAEVAGAVTPVPGGVGPLTIAMLMANTIKAAELRLAAGR